MDSDHVVKRQYVNSRSICLVIDTTLSGLPVCRQKRYGWPYDQVSLMYNKRLCNAMKDHKESGMVPRSKTQKSSKPREMEKTNASDLDQANFYCGHDANSCCHLTKSLVSVSIISTQLSSLKSLRGGVGPPLEVAARSVELLLLLPLGRDVDPSRLPSSLAGWRGLFRSDKGSLASSTCVRVMNSMRLLARLLRSVMVILEFMAPLDLGCFGPPS